MFCCATLYNFIYCTVARQFFLLLRILYCSSTFSCVALNSLPYMVLKCRYKTAHSLNRAIFSVHHTLCVALKVVHVTIGSLQVYVITYLLTYLLTYLFTYLFYFSGYRFSTVYW